MDDPEVIEKSREFTELIYTTRTCKNNKLLMMPGVCL